MIVVGLTSGQLWAAAHSLRDVTGAARASQERYGSTEALVSGCLRDVPEVWQSPAAEAFVRDGAGLESGLRTASGAMAHASGTLSRLAAAAEELAGELAAHEREIAETQRAMDTAWRQRADLESRLSATVDAVEAAETTARVAAAGRRVAELSWSLRSLRTRAGGLEERWTQLCQSAEQQLSSVVATLAAAGRQLSPVEYAPSPTASDAYRGRVGASWWLFDFSRELTLVRGERADKMVELTLVDATLLGAGPEVGAQTTAGPVGAEATLALTAAGVMRGGDTWVVPADEADRTQRRLMGLAGAQATSNPTGGRVTIREALARSTLPAPDIRYESFSTQARANYRGDAGRGDVRAGSSGEVGASVTLGREVDRHGNDPAAWRNTVFFETAWSWQLGGRLRGPAGDLLGAGGGKDTTTRVAVTRDLNRVATEVVVATTVTGGAQMQGTAKDTTDDRERSRGLQVEHATSTVSTVSVPLHTEADRSIADRLEWGLGTATSPAEIRAAFEDLGELAWQQGQVTQVTYALRDVSAQAGMKVAAGKKASAQASGGWTRQEPIAASYLSPPDHDGNRTWQNTDIQ